jgi:hypothetical protein
MNKHYIVHHQSAKHEDQDPRYFLTREEAENCALLLEEEEYINIIIEEINAN